MLAVRCELQSEVSTLKKLLLWVLDRWKWFLWGLLVLVSLGIFLWLWQSDRSEIALLTDQSAAQRWESEGKSYAQASVYLPDEDAISSSSIPSIRLAMENALTDAGVPSEDYPWYFALSRTTQSTLSSDDGKLTATVDVTMVTGQYFRLHPMVIRTGWYMSEDDVMHDRIILDLQTAWDLFYTDDVVGQFLQWNGQRYQVAAVVDYPEGTYNEKASGDTRRAWVYYDSPGVNSTDISASGTSDTDAAGDNSNSTSSEVSFTCMEVVVSQPVKGYAVSALQTVLKDYLPEDTVYTDNTGRFSLSGRWSILRSLSTRGISNKAIGYPYYENAAQLLENHLALRLIPEFFTLLFPAVSLIIWLFLLNRRRRWGLYSIPIAIDNAIDRRNTRLYEARLNGNTGESEKKHRLRRKEKSIEALEYDQPPRRRFRKK